MNSIYEVQAVILAVHGIYQSCRSFDFQADLAMTRTIVIALDLPLHGETVTPDGLELSAGLMADSIHSVIEYLSLKEVNLFLMEWSFGGWVLGTYLQQYGLEGIQGLILISSLFGDMAKSFAHVKDYKSIETISTLSDPDASLLSVLNATQQFVGMLRYQNTEDVASEDVSLCLGYNIRSVMRLRGLSAPMVVVAQTPVNGVYKPLNEPGITVLMMTGKQDMLLPLGWFREMASELSHVEIHEIDNCGHSVFAEYPEMFNSLLSTFVHKHLG